MKKINIGKIVSTHGIKGELKILSSFPYKERVFGVGKKILIDEKEYVITSYRVHKKYDMITLEGYSNINDVLSFLKKNVYVKEEDLHLLEDEILDEDLIQFEVLTKEGKRGIIKEIFYASETNKILRVQFEKEVLIPMNSEMITKIDKEKKEIIVHLIDGML